MRRSPPTTLLVCWLSAEAGADWSWPGCPDVGDADFRHVTLLQQGRSPDPLLEEPVKMAFERDASGKVDTRGHSADDRKNPSKALRLFP